MKLRGKAAAEQERLRCTRRLSQFFGAWRHGEHVVMPLHPRTRSHHVRKRAHDIVVPANLGFGGTNNRAAKSSRHRLRSETDAIHRHTAIVRYSNERELCGNFVGDMRPVNAPVAAKQNHLIDGIERRPLAGTLAMTLRNRITVVTKSFACEPGIAIVGVGKKQRAHGCTVGDIMERASISIESIVAARAKARAYVQHTPVTTSAALSAMCGGDIVLKVESLQRTGSFKIRGALNKLSDLGDAALNGVTAGSAGNHAQALAFAARTRNVRCEIFVPAGASISKVAACRGYGATVVEGGDSLDDAVASARARAGEANMAFCHPFDDLSVITGQATLGLELLEDIENLRQVIIPLGGGGLASGVALALKQQLPHVRVIGVQVDACAPYVHGSAPAGAVVTLADGIAVKRPGDITRPLVEQWLDEIVVVDENSVADAMMLLLEHSKLVVEGAGAVGVAALITKLVQPATDGNTCVVLSGGNVDLGVLPGLVSRHETRAGRRLIVFARISDRPGGLARLLALFAELGANLIEVEHVRDGVDLHVRETGVQAVLEVKGRGHADDILAAAHGAGYEVAEISSR